jgi:hypothetical protein
MAHIHEATIHRHSEKVIVRIATTAKENASRLYNDITGLSDPSMNKV